MLYAYKIQGKESKEQVNISVNEPRVFVQIMAPSSKDTGMREAIQDRRGQLKLCIVFGSIKTVEATTHITQASF